MKKGLVPLLMVGLILSGCDNSNVSSSSNSSLSESSISEASSSSSSSKFTGYVNLKEALSNTHEYALMKPYQTVRPNTEIYAKDIYYNDFFREGYVELDNDKGYIHGFTTEYIALDTYESKMKIYGKNGYTEHLSAFESRTLKYIINTYVNSFKKEEKNIYKSTDRNCIYAVAEFFQTKSYKYATEIHIVIGQDDKLEEIRIYELDYLLHNEYFIDVDYRDLDMYKYWVDAGSNVEERIYDYKSIVTTTNDYISTYENEEVEFEATVIAKDSYGYVYVANRDDNIGHLGIKVDPNAASDNVNVKDIVKVKGTVKTSNVVTTITNAKITDTNVDAKFAPIFDEDTIVDSYGGGTYAAQLFSGYPYFGDSLYSTAVYVYDLPEYSDTKDIVVDLICPDQKDANNNLYHMELIIPSNLSDAQKTKLYNALKDASHFESPVGYELWVDSFITKWDITYPYRIKLLATEDSDIYKRLTPVEKVEKYVGLANFPVMNGKAVIGFKFGGFSGMFIEEEYGYEAGDVEGVFIAFYGVSADEVKEYYSIIEQFGAVKYDEIKDAYNYRHVIYQKSGTNIDFQYSGDDGFSTPILTIWIYNGTLIQGNLIKNIIDEKIGRWFNVDNFLKLAGTYDADYTFIELKGYADNFYTLEDPLNCIVIDTQESIFDEYIQELINMGYKSYRRADNKQYTYKSRGQTHYLLVKDDVFLDIAEYHTSDYTYTGHSEFVYRLEILIYKDGPLQVNMYDNVDVLSDLYAEQHEDLAYNITLPEGCSVEIWRDLKDYRLSNVDYGYGCRDEAFIYTQNVEGVYQACKEGLLESGYNLTKEGTYSALFNKEVDGKSYSMLVMKEPEKGYVRLFNSLGGVDFIR